LDSPSPIFIEVYNNNGENDLAFYSIYKISNGDIAGYEPTDLIYSDDLIAEPTDTVTTILDKIN
jgi:hypothetical protein